jgi:hypothetical protein
VENLGLGTDSNGKLGHLILLTAVFFTGVCGNFGGLCRDVRLVGVQYSGAVHRDELCGGV